VNKNIVLLKSRIKNKFGLSNTKFYLVVGFFSFLIGTLMFTFFAPNYYHGESPKHFEIKNGATLNSVIDSLCKADIISSRSSMQVAALLYGAESNIKAGRYTIPNGLSYLQLIELLIEGSPSEQTLVTIPEGIWQHDLAALLQSKLKIDNNKFMKYSSDKLFLKELNIKSNNIEGYLLPETYYFYDDSDSKEIIRKLKSEMDKIFEPQKVKDQMKLLNYNKNQILTLASIIEGESNLSNEFKIISGVYHNRLKKGILLQADPTIQYLKRNRRSKNRVYYKDLEIDSPYNTYKYAGLPPGPINNPGKDAVLAAIFPENNNYYYFVADGTGGHKFAKSHSQHLKNVANYRRWRRTQ